MDVARDRFVRLLLAPDLAPLRDALEAGELDALLPGLRERLDRPQLTRYHALTNLRHSVATSSRLPPTLADRLTGLLHDVGKHEVVSINGRGEETYSGHAEAGATIGDGYLAALGIDGADAARIHRLIARHMDLHFACAQPLGDRPLRRLIARLGADLPDLARLAVADAASMHPSVVEARLAEHRALRRQIAERAATDGHPVTFDAALDAEGPHPWAAEAVAE